MTMYPIWLTMWNDRMRRTSVCAAAPSTPVTMVTPAATSSRVWVKATSAVKSRVKTRISAYTPTLVSSPANTADTAAGGVWYDAGSQ